MPKLTIWTTEGTLISRKAADRLLRRGLARPAGDRIEVLADLSPQELNDSLAAPIPAKPKLRFIPELHHAVPVDQSWIDRFHGASVPRFGRGDGKVGR
jgi:hypothetical protein